MANEKEPTPGTRGWRADQVRLALDVDRQGFAKLLAAVAAELGLDSGGKWTQSRVSRLLLSRQPITLDDAASVVALAARKGLRDFGWDWFVYGEKQRIAQPDFRLDEEIPEPKALPQEQRHAVGDTVPVRPIRSGPSGQAGVGRAGSGASGGRGAKGKPPRRPR